MPTATELNATLTTKRGELKSLFDAHRNDKGEYTHNTDQIAEINKRNDELGALVDQYQQARALEEIEAKNKAELETLGRITRPSFGGRPGQDADPAGHRDAGLKTLGQLYVESKAYRERRVVRFDVEFPDVSLKSLPLPAEVEEKALLSRTAGWDPFVPRIPRVVLSAQRRPVVADLVPTDEISQSSIKFMEETTFTNNAAAVSEGGTKPESALGFTERSQPVEKIATWLPVTEEQIEDAPQIRSVVDNRLRLMLELTEEAQLLTGSGVSPNLMGFLNKTGVQTQAKGADPTPDAFFKAMTLVRFTGFADPTGHIIHPNDWQDIRLLRTADGLYIWGNPSEAGPERLWGLPVIVTPAITEGTGFTGDFQMYAQIFRRKGVRIETADQHDTYFVRNLLAIRAETRLVLVIYRGAAFSRITGI